MSASSPTLTALALRVNELLSRTSCMTAAKKLAESCLADPSQSRVDALQFPTAPDNPLDWTDDSLARERGTEEYAVLTPGQMALLVAALHDVYCHGVEKVFAVTVEPIAPPDDPTGAAYNTEFGRWVRLTRALEEVRKLGEYAAPWFTLQVRRFESITKAGDGAAETPAIQAVSDTGAKSAHQTADDDASQYLRATCGPEAAESAIQYLRDVCGKFHREGASCQSALANDRQAVHFALELFDRYAYDFADIVGNENTLRQSEADSGTFRGRNRQGAIVGAALAALEERQAAVVELLIKAAHKTGDVKPELISRLDLILRKVAHEARGSNQVVFRLGSRALLSGWEFKTDDERQSAHEGMAAFHAWWVITGAGASDTQIHPVSKPMSTTAPSGIPNRGSDSDQGLLDIKRRAHLEQQARDDQRIAFRERAEKEQRCRDATKAFMDVEHALWSEVPSKVPPLLHSIHRALIDVCKALAEAGRLAVWEEVDHHDTYKRFSNSAIHVMTRSSYDWARALFDKTRDAQLPLDLVMETWETETLRQAFRWVRIFVAGLSGEGAVLSYVSPRAVTADAASTRLPKNPLHELIGILDHFFRMGWARHHADTEEKQKQTLDAWKRETSPFWLKFKRPAEALRALADPVVAWCTRNGCGDTASAAIINDAAGYVTWLALKPLVVMPHVYANKAEATEPHERQGERLLAADKCFLSLRELAGRAGDAWQPETDEPAPTQAEKTGLCLPLEHSDPTRCPGCKASVSAEYATLPKVRCPTCGRWEIQTGLSVVPAAGPPGTPPSIVRLHAPLLRPVPPSAVPPREADGTKLPVTPTLLAGPLDDATTIHFHGGKAYSIGNSGPITVTDPEDAVLQAFLPLPSMDGRTLGEKSGYGDRAPKILRDLRKKRNGLFASAIRLPGGKSGGGYHVAIRKA